MRHHPGEDLLFDYASGALSQSLCVVVATHLTLCPVCRREVDAFEAIGGALMAQAADGALPVAVPSLDAPAAEPAAPVPQPRIPGLPQPLSALLARQARGIVWRRVLPGLQECRIPLDGQSGARLKLYKIKGGTAIPRHTHRGRELTLVLEGGFSDLTGHYGPGDVADADGALEHRPVADLGDDCICVAAITAPLRLSGLWGRFVPAVW